MGRELRRVPLDFEWELNKRWEGFCNPHYKACPNKSCSAGYSPEGKAFEHICTLLCMMADASVERPDDFVADKYGQHREMRVKLRHNTVNYPHPYITRAGIADVGPRFHEIVDGLMGERVRWGDFFSGGSNAWKLQQQLMKSAGIEREWTICPTCDGDGMDPAVKEAYEAWKSTEPPTGEGYQIWETTSEGSPISPVFAVPELLANYMARHNSGATDGTTYEQWLSFINGPGWAPSMVIKGGQIMSGVTAMSKLSEENEDGT